MACLSDDKWVLVWHEGRLLGQRPHRPCFPSMTATRSNQRLEAREMSWAGPATASSMLPPPINKLAQASRSRSSTRTTGARTPWRVLATAPIGGVVPDPPIITPDGNTYGFDYRVRLSDLYTVTGVR